MDDFDVVASRLRMHPERLEKLFEAAEIDFAHAGLPASLAKLSYWLNHRVVPELHSELEQRKALLVLERKLRQLEDRHERTFGISPVLPEQLHVTGKIDLINESLRLRVPMDDRYSALRALYLETFFAPPPTAMQDAIEDWVNNVLTAIHARRPFMDSNGVAYVDSSKFRG